MPNASSKENGRGGADASAKREIALGLLFLAGFALQWERPNGALLFPNKNAGVDVPLRIGIAEMATRAIPWLTPIPMAHGQNQNQKRKSTLGPPIFVSLILIALLPVKYDMAQ